ncbi:MAG: RNA methyltransferase [Candidatus Cryptobacteroides sp.]
MSKLSASEIKHIKALSGKKYRDESRSFIVEGEKMLSEALNSGFELLSSYKTEDIGEAQMSRISSLSSPSPVLGILKMPDNSSLPELKSNGLYLALDSVRDPGNLGTILRICDWFGVDGLFASEDSVDQFNPKVVQASMGSIFRKTLIYTDLEHLCRLFLDKELPIYATLLNGKNIYETELKPYGLILMGNESRGVSEPLRRLCTDALLIPSFAQGTHAESLNVAVATALTLSEFKRRDIYEK